MALSQNYQYYIRTLGASFHLLNLDHLTQCLTLIKYLNFKHTLWIKKPDIVILNKTWLSKNINDNEMFPSPSYKVFRLYRTKKSHPMDPVDPNKYRKMEVGSYLLLNLI